MITKTEFLTKIEKYNKEFLSKGIKIPGKNGILN